MSHWILWFAMPFANGCLLCCLTRIQRLRRRSIGSLDGFWGWRSPQSAAGGRDCGRNTKKFRFFRLFALITPHFLRWDGMPQKHLCFLSRNSKVDLMRTDERRWARGMVLAGAIIGVVAWPMWGLAVGAAGAFVLARLALPLFRNIERHGIRIGA